LMIFFRSRQKGLQRTPKVAGMPHLSSPVDRLGKLTPSVSIISIRCPRRSAVTPRAEISLLSSILVSDIPEVKGVLGQLYLDGALVPKDVQKGVRLLSIWAVWDYDARLRLMATLRGQPRRDRLSPRRHAL